MVVVSLDTIEQASFVGEIVVYPMENMDVQLFITKISCNPEKFF